MMCFYYAVFLIVLDACEVKSALYDADDAAQDAGAEVLLDEARGIVGGLGQPPIPLKNGRRQPRCCT